MNKELAMEHTSRNIVANTMLFTGTLAVQKVISFLYFWFISSRLGPESLGTYIWALSFTTLFSIGVDLGLAPLLTREAARDPNRVERLLQNVLGLKIFFAIGTVILLAGALIVTKRPTEIMIVVGVAALVMIFDSFSLTFWSVLRARQNVWYESVAMLGFHVVLFGLGAYLLRISASAVFAAVALAVVSLLVFVFSMGVVRFKYGMHLAPRFGRETRDSILGLLPPFAVSGIFVRLYNAADTIILGYLAGSIAVGLYSIPAKVVTALQVLIPGAIVATLYPAMSYQYKTNHVILERIFLRALGYLVLLVIPLTVGLVVLAPSLVGTIWPEYREIIPTFQLMTLGLPFLFATFPTGYFLNAADRAHQNTFNRGVITVLNIALNIALIPTIGVRGAGIAFLTTNIILFFLDMRNVRAVIPFSWKWLAGIFWKSALASAVMGYTLIMLGNRLPVVAAIFAGMALYAILIFILRAVSREEIQFIREIIVGKPSPEVL